MVNIGNDRMENAQTDKALGMYVRSYLDSVELERPLKVAPFPGMGLEES